MKKDKKLHFLAGFIIALIVAVIATWYNIDTPNIILGSFLGYGTSMVITILKEIIWDDLMGKGVFSWKDIEYGLWGAIIGVLLNIIIYFLLI